MATVSKVLRVVFSIANKLSFYKVYCDKAPDHNNTAYKSDPSMYVYGQCTYTHTHSHTTCNQLHVCEYTLGKAEQYATLIPFESHV